MSKIFEIYRNMAYDMEKAAEQEGKKARADAIFKLRQILEGLIGNPSVPDWTDSVFEDTREKLDFLVKNPDLPKK